MGSRAEAVNKMKQAAKLYNAYKKKNPNGSKKMCDFVKEVWKGKKKSKKSKK